MQALVQMLDGTEERIEVTPVERDNFKLAPPLTVPSRWGTLKYIGKGQDSIALYKQQ